MSFIDNIYRSLPSLSFVYSRWQMPHAPLEQNTDAISERQARKHISIHGFLRKYLFVFMLTYYVYTSLLLWGNRKVSHCVFRDCYKLKFHSVCITEKQNDCLCYFIGMDDLMASQLTYTFIILAYLQASSICCHKYWSNYGVSEDYLSLNISRIDFCYHLDCQ